MRNLLFVSALLASSSLFAQATTVVDAPLDHLFIPSGFDNNDNVEVVVTGKFPNPCYTRNDISVDVKNDVIMIDVTARMEEDQENRRCEDLKVPFSETVRVGSLQAGDYKIIVNKGSEYELRGAVDIAVSTSSSVDEHIYAQVDYIELGFTGGLSGDALLIGSSISPCLALDRVEYLSNKKDTFSVLPIMKKISNNCPEARKRLQIPIKFNPSALANNKLMLFVRSVDGKSVHTFVEKE